MTTSSPDRSPPAVAAWHPPDLGSITGTPAAMAANAAGEETRRVAWLDGHTSAMAERDAETRAAVAACQAAVQAMRDTSNQLHAQVASTVHALAVAIARHLLERELALDPTLVQQLVNRALTIAPMNGAVTPAALTCSMMALCGAMTMRSKTSSASPSAQLSKIFRTWAPDLACMIK